MAVYISLEEKINQVKIRGCRLELGEIEAVLCQHPSLAETIVIAQEDPGAEKRLVAYLVPHHPSFLSQCNVLERHLRDFLLKKLPCYMNPNGICLFGLFTLKSQWKS